MFKGYIQFLQGFDHFGGVRRYPAKAKSHKDIYLLHQTSPHAPFKGGGKAVIQRVSTGNCAQMHGDLRETAHCFVHAFRG